MTPSITIQTAMNSIRILITVSKVLWAPIQVTWFKMTAQMVITAMKMAGIHEINHFMPPSRCR